MHDSGLRRTTRTHEGLRAAPGRCAANSPERRESPAKQGSQRFFWRRSNNRCLNDWKLIACSGPDIGISVALLNSPAGHFPASKYDQLRDLLESHMPAVNKPLHQKGDFLVDYEEKVFPDVKAEPGEKALVTFHTVAFEGSIGFVNLLQATRLQRKGFETSVLLYGPGVTLGLQRGFPTLGDEAFPGHLNFNKQLMKFMEEGGKVYACRFALQALYGQGEASLIEGIRAINPLDVLDIQLLHRKDNALVIHTWTV
jgi:uncharacterized repeat protein (TIGR04044 family)